MEISELKSWREAHGLTQEEAAEKLGVTRVYYNSWENGKYKIPHWVDKILVHEESPEILM
jgi:transcriptional regulator with XRE-family HTH domain